MVVIRSGIATPEKQRARTVLSVRDPYVESLLAGLGVDAHFLDELRAFAKSLMRSRNSWDIHRRAVGIFGHKRLNKHEADRSLRKALTAMEMDDEHV